MCYHVSSPKIRKILDDNPHMKAPDLIEFDGFFHVNGFARPMLPVTLNTSPDIVSLSKWGYTPSWAPSVAGHPLLNTRGDELFDKKSVAEATRKSRYGLLWIDGFYEPHKVEGEKKTENYYIHMPDKAIFTLGIVFNEWIDKTTGEVIPTFSVLTTPANDRMAWIHNEMKRMPLVIMESERNVWLSAKNKEDIESMIKPLPDGLLQDYKIKLRPTGGKEDFNTPLVQEPAEDNNFPKSLFD